MEQLHDKLFMTKKLRLFSVVTKNVSDVCKGHQIPNGKIYPEEVIEGSVVSVRCDDEFRTEGEWKITCTNGRLKNNSGKSFPKCIPLKKGLF